MADSEQNNDTHRDDSRAAAGLWTWLAAFAWAHYEAAGRGAVLVQRDELHAAYAQHQRDEQPIMSPSYFLAEHVPKGEDFRAVLMQYDPQREIVLIVGGHEQDEVLLRLSCEHGDRPTPQACCETVRGA
jgi:hypothetical protein